MRRHKGTVVRFLKAMLHVLELHAAIVTGKIKYLGLALTYLAKQRRKREGEENKNG